MYGGHGRESGHPPELAPEPSHPHVVVAERSFHPPQLKRVAKKFAAAVGLAVVFVAAAAGGLLLHMDLPAARRLVAGAVNELLGGTVRGKIGIVRLARLAPDGIDGGVITLSDPEGRRVALLEGVRARISIAPLLASIIAGRDLKVRVTELSIDHLDALLTEGQDGALTVVEAFQPAEAGPPPPPKKDAGGLDLSLAKITLRHAWIHGAMSGLPIVDADVDDVAAAFAIAPERTTVDLARLRAMTRGMPGRNVAAAAEAHLVLPADPADKMNGSGKIAGAVGGIGLHAEGKIDGSQVDATLDVPRIDPGFLNDAVGAAVLNESASLHVEAHGTLPHLDPIVHLTLGSGTVDARAQVTLPSEGQSDLLARVTVVARDLDARATSASGPASKIGLDASAEVRLAASGSVDGTYGLHLLPGAVGGQATPDTRVEGSFRPTSVRGTAHVAEPGMPADLRFDVNPVAQEIAFDARVDAPDLAQVSRLGGAVSGCATVHAEGKVALAAKKVSARVDATLDRIDQATVGVGHAEMSASAEGSLTAPLVVFALVGRELRAGRYVYPVFHATADGPLDELHVGADMGGGKDAAVKLAAVVGAAGGVSARDVVLEASKGKDTITARVGEATFEGGRLDARGVRLEGAGDPLDGEVHLRAGSLRARVAAARVDVPTILRVAGIESDLRAGSVGLDVDLQASARATRGHANVTVRSVTYGKEVQGAEANLKTEFDGETATLHFDARDASKSTLTIDATDGKLGGGALDARAWERATGHVRGVAQIDLHRIGEMTGTSKPFEKLKGWLTAEFEVGRDQAGQRPTLALDAATRGLVVTLAPSTVSAGAGTEIAVGRTIHSKGVDAHVNARLDAQSGEATLAFLVADTKGPILEVNGGTTLPMDPLLAGDGAAAREALLGTQVKAHVEAPLRALDAVPTVASTVPVRGKVGLTLDATGTARAPKLKFAFQGRDLAAADDPTPHPLALDGSVDYDGEAAHLAITAQSGQATVLDVTGEMALRVRDVLAGGAAPWEANADVAFDKFPIGAATGLLDENAIDGDLSGKIALHDLHKAGNLDVKLDLANIDINGTPFGDTTAAVAVKDGALTADVQVKQTDGFASVHARTGMKWGASAAPSLDEKSGLDVGLRAKDFRLAMVAPFVRRAVSELDGRLNADAKLHVTPGMKDGTMDGAIVLDKGLFETPQVGQEFHDLRARIFMKPWGTWNVAEISASGTTGHFTARAFAKMSGLKFQSGEAHLRIAEGDKLPLTMQGISYGTVWGNVDTKARLAKDGQTIDIDVNVPKLHVGLPESIGHSVQSTDPDPTVKVGALADNGEMTVLPIDGSAPPQKPSPPPQKGPPSGPTATPRTPTKLHVVTHLGPDFEVRRTGMLRVYVAHGPTIDVGDDTKISGDIALPRGYVELQGKRFQIEKATVNFTGQAPDNPVVIATAAYDSPDGTRVYADFVGPAKTGKVTLRSEPQLSQNEILALLLFGTADGTFGQAAPEGQQGNNVTQAASLAGGLVTEGLNKAISGVSGIEVQTKVDTQESGDPRPEVEVALSRDVSATVIYNLGVPPPGQNPDDTLLVVDWRFHRNYSTEATLGDKGTSILDLTWKYRY